MTPDEREQMFILCQRLAVEEDLREFSKYVVQLNALLDLKSDRIKNAPSSPSTRV
jgi:hypothetical protein